MGDMNEHDSMVTERGSIMPMLIISSIQLGLLYAIMAMGVYMTFRILNLPDMTVDGSFVLGMAVSAILTLQGHPYLAILAAALIGATAGIVTGLLQTKIKINAILSGILVMTSLYTVNLAVMGGKSNLSLNGKKSIFNNVDTVLTDMIYRSRTGTDIDLTSEVDPALLKDIKVLLAEYSISKTIVAVVACIIMFIILAVFYKTKIGLAIRATGDNEDMVRSSSINADLMKCMGLALGNACVALSGAMISQYQMFSDVNSGSGMVVMGLASVIIGETLFGKRSVTRGFLSVIIGSVIYWMIRAMALKYNIFPAYALKLVSSAIVALALAIPTIMESMKHGRQRREAKNHFNRS